MLRRRKIVFRNENELKFSRFSMSQKSDWNNPSPDPTTPSAKNNYLERFSNTLKGGGAPGRIISTNEWAVKWVKFLRRSRVEELIANKSHGRVK